MITFRHIPTLFVAIVALAAGMGCAQRPSLSKTSADTLYSLPEEGQTRWSSWENPYGRKGEGAQARGGRKGSPSLTIRAGQSVTLAEVVGESGTVRRIWVTIRDRSPQALRGIRWEMYWDGATEPAVSCPIGDFFGQGLGQMARFDNALFSSPEARSFNCFVPMPFRTGMKVVVTNDTDVNQGMFYEINYTIGDAHPDGMAYFHAHWRRENPTTMQRDYEILPRLEGRGRFLGVNFGVIPDQSRYGKTWWGEGEVKVYLDGDGRFPTLAGTGTEDYIGTGWGQGQYATLYQGCTVADRDAFRYCFYRLHVPDPVYFHREIRVTIQQIGWASVAEMDRLQAAGTKLYKAGPGPELRAMGETGLFEREDDWSSCAWFYLDRPTSGLPPLPPLAERIAGLVQ